MPIRFGNCLEALGGKCFGVSRSHNTMQCSLLRAFVFRNVPNAHFKHPADSEFGVLDGALKDASMSRVVASIEDLQEVLEQSAKEALAKNPGGIKRFYYNYMPPPKAEVKMTKLVPSCFTL